MAVLAFRVLSKRDVGVYWTVSVSDVDQTAHCNCSAFTTMCSHIDATLIANERAMVHPDDRDIADKAYLVCLGVIAAPKSWKGIWRKNLAWRGLSGGPRKIANPRTSGKPLVCFTGKLPPKERKDWIAEARAHGWETTDEPSRFTDVLVAADPSGNSAKLKLARKHQTPVVDAEEWLAVMVDGVLPLD